MFLWFGISYLHTISNRARFEPKSRFGAEKRSRSHLSIAGGFQTSPWCAVPPVEPWGKSHPSYPRWWDFWRFEIFGTPKRINNMEMQDDATSCQKWEYHGISPRNIGIDWDWLGSNRGAQKRGINPISWDHPPWIGWWYPSHWEIKASKSKIILESKNSASPIPSSSIIFHHLPSSFHHWSIVDFPDPSPITQHPRWSPLGAGPNPGATAMRCIGCIVGAAASRERLPDDANGECPCFST